MSSQANGGTTVPGNLEVFGNAHFHGDATVSGSIAVAAVAYVQLTPSADPPDGATEGAIYMDTDHKLYVHNGTTWCEVTMSTP